MADAEKQAETPQIDPSAEYISAKQAREILGVSPNKIAELIRNGVLPTIDNPLDRRMKLVPRATIEELRQRYVMQDKDALSQ